MEPLSAATSFRTFIAFSVFLQNIVICIECSNRSFDMLCPQKCSCDRNLSTVNCTNANYTDVPPDLPSGTRKLILDGNLLHRLTNESLSRLVGVSYLSLRNCSIKDVDDKGFSHLSESLKVLNMSRNPLKIKSCTFLEHLRRLVSLDLSRTGIRAYPKVLKNLLDLKQVILKHNRIRKFPTSSTIRTVKYLILSENLIKALPTYEGNADRHPKLDTLSLKANKIRDLKNHGFRLFPMLESLDLSQNHLRDVPPLAFRSKSLKIINLYKAKFRLYHKNRKIFRPENVPNIQIIKMGFCKIEDGFLKRFVFFKNLRNLTELDLSGTGIESFSRMFVNLPNLTKLRLSSNPISTLEKENFYEISNSLLELSVSSAKLSTVNFESLPKEVWKNLKVVDFSDNPFKCYCSSFLWLRYWLKRANASGVEVRGWDRYYCQKAETRVSMFQQERPSESACFQHYWFLFDPHLFLVFLVTSVIWITAPVLHRIQWHLNYWYLMKNVSALNEVLVKFQEFM